jgi:hypothetical protein
LDGLAKLTSLECSVVVARGSGASGAMVQGWIWWLPVWAPCNRWPMGAFLSLSFFLFFTKELTQK